MIYELQVLYQVYLYDDWEETVLFLFFGLDQDISGYLDLQEWSIAVSAWGGHYDMQFNEADTDGDELISVDEFEVIMKQVETGFYGAGAAVLEYSDETDDTDDDSDDDDDTDDE